MSLSFRRRDGSKHPGDAAWLALQAAGNKTVEKLAVTLVYVTITLFRRKRQYKRIITTDITVNKERKVVNEVVNGVVNVESEVSKL